MTNYPGSLDNSTSLPDPSPTDSTLGAHAALHTNENAAIRALEAKLGSIASTPGAAGQTLISNGNNGSTWGFLPNTGGGGTATSPLTSKGDIWGYSTVDSRIPVGANNTVLTADSTQPLGVKWAAVSGTGTVTTLSVTTANGFAGTVTNATTTPAITLTTTITGIVKGNGTGLSAAIASDFPTLNQNTTGTAANITGTLAVAQGGSGATATTGAGSNVLSGSPTLTGTPSIAAAVATSLNVSGQITSTQATGTAPLVIASTTNVPNLNADTVDSIHASATPTAGQLFPLGTGGIFPASVITQPITWTTPTLGTGWGAFDSGAIPTTTTGQYRYPRYFKDVIGMVHISGLAKNTSGAANTTATNTTIFTLPVGFRPGHTIRINTEGNSGASDTLEEIDIDALGAVNLTGVTNVPTTQWINLNNIHFLAEQ